MTDIAAPAPRTTADGYHAMVRQKRLYGGLVMVIFVALMASGFRLAEDRNAGGFLNGILHVFDFPSEVLSEAWHNRATIPAFMAANFGSLIETINIAAVSTLIGTLFGAVFAVLTTRGLARWPMLVPILRRMMDAARAVPEIVVALVLIYVMGGGPVPAVIAIALHSSGALGKLFSEAAENADLKPVEGLNSVGASWLQSIWLGVLPQVAPNWLSYALLRFEINIRASAILGFVGSGGIGYSLKLAMQWGQGKYDQVVAIFILLFAAIVLFDQLSSMARNRLVKGATS